MYLKWNLTGVIAFIILGSLIYLWGPGWSNWWRAGISLLLYVFVFGACFVVVQRR